jgi:hypothetical protein
MAVPSCPAQNSQPTRLRGWRDTTSAPINAPSPVPSVMIGNELRF